MANSGDQKFQQGSTNQGEGAEKATEADRHGGKQPAKEKAERDFEDSAKENGE